MSSNLPLISEKDASDLDQYIYPQKGGDETLLELWQMNGHYLSLRYVDLCGRTKIQPHDKRKSLTAYATATLILR